MERQGVKAVKRKDTDWQYAVAAVQVAQEAGAVAVDDFYEVRFSNDIAQIVPLSSEINCSWKD